MGFERSYSSRLNPVARSPLAFRPMGYRPTVHGACAAQCGLGVVVLWPNNAGCAPRSPPRRQPRLDRTDTAAGGRHGLQKAVIAAFESRGSRPRAFRPAEYQPTTHGARTEQCGLGVVIVLWPNAGRALLHAASATLGASEGARLSNVAEVQFVAQSAGTISTFMRDMASRRERGSALTPPCIGGASRSADGRVGHGRVVTYCYGLFVPSYKITPLPSTYPNRPAGVVR